MNQWNELKPQELSNAFSMIGEDWMLITAAKGDKVNTMTASWGGIGIMWGKPVAYLVIRPQRYTKEFIDNSDTLSINFLDSSYRSTLTYLGKVSGRDEDKITNSKLTTSFDDATPYFEESNKVLLCKKLFAQELTADSFIDKTLLEKWYPGNDLHTLYVVEISKILSK